MRYLAFLPLLFTLGCNNDSPSSVPLDTDHRAMVDSLEQQDPKISDSPLPVVGTLQIDTTDLQPEPEGPIQIMMAGSFHKKEVWQGVQQKQWLALTYEQGAYKLEAAQVAIKPVYDSSADQDSLHLSGRRVGSDKANAILFISGLRQFKKGAIDTVAYGADVMLPGGSIQLKLKNKTYVLSAFGDSTAVEGADYATIQNYGWKITGPKNNKMLTQLLAEDGQFDSAIYVLLWCGDLDDDGIPDLLADLSNHYSKSKITLFLSHSAQKGKLYGQATSFEFLK